MTFIPLEKINFVKNKIKNDIHVRYKNSDSSSYVYDQVIDSKALLPNSSFRILDESLIKESLINTFYQNASVNNTTPTEMFDILDRVKGSTLVNPRINNDDIKLYNFKNEFKIEKINQSFLPSSDSLRKKDILKKIIYPSYNENYSLDYYTNLNFGFCNYSSINFFSNFLNNSEDTHSNCIMYPNISNGTKNTYNFFRNNEYSLSFYLNQRKKVNTTPNCILHVPGSLTLYSIFDSNSNKYNLSVSIGDKSIEKFGGRGNSYNSSNKSQGYYFFNRFDFDPNKWYNICLLIKNSGDTKKDIKLYIDGVLYIDEVLLTNKSTFNFNDSFISVGNKPNYINRTSGFLVKEIDDIVYYYFGTKLNNEEFNNGLVSGPSILKDISLGNGFQLAESSNRNIETIEAENNEVRFEDGTNNPNGETESFHGEIHDIRIYSSYLSEDKIKTNCKNNISDIVTEVDDFSLEFYVPVLYLSLDVKSNGLLNLHKNDDNSLNKFNQFYNNYFNPYLSSFCGIMHISTENYLVEFVKAVKPNVVIDGVDGNSYRIDEQGLITKVLDNSENTKSIKKGVFAQHLYNSLLVSGEDKDEDLNKNNLSYRNLMILPNDNGLIDIDFNIISSFIDLHTNITVDQNFYKINSSSSKEFYNITNSEVLNKSIYLNTKDENTKLNFISKLSNFTQTGERINPSIFIRPGLFFGGPLKFDYELTGDTIQDLSNFIYHDLGVTNLGANELGYVTGFLDSTILSFKELFELSVYPFTKSNPVNRFYHDNLNNINISFEYIKEDLVNNINIKYLRLPIPYNDINQDFDNPFISIFDVPTKIYNKKIKKGTFILKDSDIITTGGNLSLSFKDNKYGTIYRSDCLTKQATWNYVGHIFYQDGLFVLNNPVLNYFGEKDFEVEFMSETNLYVNEINIPCDEGLFDKSRNETYDESLRHDESAFNSEEKFVYITDVNLHDENLNIVAKAKMARPIPKKNSDNILIRLKMDY